MTPAVSTQQTTRATLLLQRNNDLADSIAKQCGHNVPYCESLDITLYDCLLSIIVGDNAYCTDEHIAKTLPFYAENNAILPDSLAHASAQQFKDYIRTNADAILDKVQSGINYYKEYYPSCPS